MPNQSTTKQSDQFTIYDYDKRAERTWKLIRKEISEINIQYIEDYEMSMLTDNLAKAGRQKHLETLLSLSRILEKSNTISEKDWKNLSKRDVDKLIKIINDTYKNPRGKETWSSHDHKKVLKIFFRWLKLGNRKMKRVGDPSETKDVVIGNVESEILREELMTPEEDRRKLLSGCRGNLRNIALIDCCFDAGPRAGEILNCKLKHITQDKYGYKIEVDGKTGQRPIRIIKAAPSLAKWLDAHPFKDDRNAAAWPKQSGTDKGTPLSYAAARQAIIRATSETKKKFSDFDKRVCFTLLRHAEITEASNFMTAAQMEDRHGWVIGSKQPRRYVHRSGVNVDRALFKQYGIKTDEDEIDPQIPKICLVCEMPNEYDANLCTKCGKPLSIQAAIAAEEKEENEKNIVLEKLSNMENDMKEMQFRYHEVKNQSMSDDDLEKLAKKIKKLDDS
jgi:integrase